MRFDRREFLHLIVAGAAASAASSPSFVNAATQPRFKALAFDAFPIFDPRPVSRLAETLFPRRGPELTNAWRTRQFEYQWLRALGGRYADFLRTTEEALVFAAKTLQLELTDTKRTQLMRAYIDLEAWPDAPAALSSLKKLGLRLVFLSNMTKQMLENGIRNAALENVFEHVLSTDQITTYKPDPRAYRLGVDTLKLKREEILFVAFAGWDVAGAKWFGYPTFWVNRLGAPAEELGVAADAAGRDLKALVDFVTTAK